ncbi:MAG TPA: ComF family protein [Stellaceae bacterium]|nr:ComF family protein [Stellaceae bacterium]
METTARPPALRRAATALLDLLLPPRCLACGATVSEAGTLCASCWRGITFLGAPCCACCGLPFEFEAGGAALCGACAREQPPFDRARAVMRYDEASRGLILAFKHGDRLHMAPAFGTWLKRAGSDIIAVADLAVPVPLHWTRLFARRYNQAAVLAHALRAAGGPPVGVDWLVRRRRTPSQGKRNAAARERNVRAAFALKPGRDVRGKRILLIDDVFTTGATVGECARVLRRAGATSVSVLTLARTVRQEG